jgi:hypothetical protein
MDDLRRRLDDQDPTAAGRLTRRVLAEAGATDPMRLSAREFNGAAEQCYRETLRRRHMEEAFRFLAEDLASADGEAAAVLHDVLHGEEPDAFLTRVQSDALDERLPAEQLERLLGLVLYRVWRDTENAATYLKSPLEDTHAAPVRRAG